MDNLPELRDIHLPDGVSIFPLAYGWWVIATSIIILPILVYLLKSTWHHSRKMYALLLLKQIKKDNVIIAATAISELLRRICVYKYPEAVNLFAKDWISFLNEHCKKHISGKTAELLSHAPYIEKHTLTYSYDDLETLVDFCKTWIGENL